MKETESVTLEADQFFNNVAPHEDADKVASTYWNLAENETRLVIVMDDDPTGIQTVHGVKMTNQGVLAIKLGDACRPDPPPVTSGLAGSSNHPSAGARPNRQSSVTTTVRIMTTKSQ